MPGDIIEYENARAFRYGAESCGEVPLRREDATVDKRYSICYFALSDAEWWSKLLWHLFVLLDFFNFLWNVENESFLCHCPRDDPESMMLFVASRL